MTAKYREEAGCPQRDSVEHEEYVGAPSASARESKERGGADDLLERILDRSNLNRAYKQVKRNHGALGIDGMTVEETLPWLREHREELLAKHTGREISAQPGAAEGNPQARWKRSAECGSWAYQR